jgi:hypothetical protein
LVNQRGYAGEEKNRQIDPSTFQSGSR